MKSFAKALSILALPTAAVLSLVVPNAALGSTRVAIVLDEYVDGQKQASTLATALLADLAGHKEIVLVDAAQAAKIRAAADGKPLLQADGRALVRATDADHLVIGEARMVKEEAPIGNLTVYQGTVTMRVLATDTAEVVGAILESARGQGLGTTKGGPHMGAVRRAAKKLSEKAKPRIEGFVIPELQRLVVRVQLSSPLAVTSGSAVVDCVKRATGEQSAQRRAQSDTELLVDFTSRQPAANLATAIGKERRCPLFVKAFSKREIIAEYSTRGRGASLTTARFKPEGAAARRRRWLASEIPTVIRAGLAESDAVSASLTDPLVSRREALRKKSRRLALIGAYSVSGDTVRVQAEVKATFGNRVLATRSATCKLNEVGTCAVQLGEAMAKALPDAVQKNLAAIPMDTCCGPDTANPLVVELRGAKEIFPARYGHYVSQGIAEVVLKNTGSERIEDVVISGELVDFGRGVSQSDEKYAVEPGGETTARLKVSLDADRLKKVKEGDSTVLKVSVDYRAGDYTYPRQQRAIGVMVMGRNALSWKQPAAVAAFVNPDSVRGLVGEVTAAVDSDVQLDTAVALFHVMTQLRYKPDPKNPWSPAALDTVYYPRETLARRGGDCDDLSVLYASLLQEAGLPAMLITTPSHVLVGIDAEAAAGLEATDDQKQLTYVQFAGRRWIPVETTKLDGTFDDAWAAASARLGDRPLSSDQAVIIDTAWQSYPPKDLAPAKLKVRVAVQPKAIKKVLAARQRKWADIVARHVEDLTKKGTAQAYNQLGIIFAKQGNLKDAEKAFEKSLRLDQSADAKNNLGNLFVLSDTSNGALALYDDALKMNPSKRKRFEILLNGVVAIIRMDGKDPALSKRRTDMMYEAKELDQARLVAFASRLPYTETTSGSDVVADLAQLRVAMEKVVGDALPKKQTKASNVSDDQLLRFLHWIN